MLLRRRWLLPLITAAFCLQAGSAPAVQPVVIPASNVGSELRDDEAVQLLQQATAAAEGGDGPRASQIWQRLMPWVRRRANPGSPMLPQSLLQVARVQHSLGQLDQAEATFQEALQLAQHLQPSRPTLLAVLLNDLADLEADLERFAEARQHLEQALAIKTAFYGDRHVEVAIGHNNLGDLLRDIGDLDAAELQLNRALTLLTPLQADQPLALAAVFNNLARLQEHRGAWSAAHASLQRAQELRLRVLKPPHPDLALGWNNLGMLALSHGDLKQARFNLQQAYDQAHRLYGDHHPGTAIQIANLGRLARASGDGIRARQLHLEAQKILEQQLGPDHPDSLNNLADLLLVRWVLGERVALLEPLQQLLHRRMKLLRTQAGGLRPRERLLLLRRRDLSWSLADAMATKIPAAAPLALGLRLSSQGLMQEIQRVQRYGGQLTDPLGPQRESWVTPAAVAAVLPPGSALIELRRYLDPTALPSDPRAALPWRYRAYVLSRNAAVQVVELGSAASVDTLIQRAYSATAQQLSDSAELWQVVGNRLLNPLRAAAPMAAAWFVVPDAGLHQVPFQALMPEREIRLLTTGRDLLWLEQTPATLPATAVVVAGNPLLTKQLPGFSLELQRLASLLGVVPLEGTAFSAAMLQRLKQPRLLHLTTHGFWYPPAPANQQPMPRSADPMLRSGLLVTAQNRVAGGPMGAEFFSAAQFLNLDLHGTELVTLSACSTGLGDLHDSEGLYGLQRGIQVAGARSVLTSLWPVDDQATIDWMLRYYQHLLRGLGRAAALAQVQAEFRHHPNASWRHPYYWAAWQLVGDWRPIRLARSSRGILN